MNHVDESRITALRRPNSDQTLPLGDICMLQALVRYYHKVLVPLHGKFMNGDQWATVTYEAITSWEEGESPSSTSATKPTANVTPAGPKQLSAAESFQRGVKRDPSQYPKLTEDKMWDSWKMNVEALARVHGVYDVLDNNHTPTDQDLYDQMSHYLFAVFLQTVQTSQGRMIDKSELASSDAREVWTKLLDHYSSSPAAKLKSDELMGFLTTAKLDSSWKRGAVHFLQNWHEQIRLFEEFTDKTSHFSSEL